MKLPPWKTLPASLALASLLLSPSWLGADPAPVTDTSTRDVTITVSEIAELAIVGAAAPGFTISAPAFAGMAPMVSTDSGNRYLQFTSINGLEGLRKITITRDARDIGHVNLKLSVPETVGGGAHGFTGDRAQAEITLETGTSYDVITDIYSGWTGTGNNDGWELTYSVDIKAFLNINKVLNFGSGTTTLTYTLTSH